MFNLSNIFSPAAAKNGRISKEDAAKLLATSSEALDMKVFGLDSKKDYFIKTGTYSSKFDFRNCHVQGASEMVRKHCQTDLRRCSYEKKS